MSHEQMLYFLRNRKEHQRTPEESREIILLEANSEQLFQLKDVMESL